MRWSNLHSMLHVQVRVEAKLVTTTQIWHGNELLICRALCETTLSILFWLGASKSFNNSSKSTLLPRWSPFYLQPLRLVNLIFLPLIFFNLVWVMGIYQHKDFGQHWRCRSPSIRCCTLLDIKAWILYIKKKIFLVAINHASCSLSF